MGVVLWAIEWTSRKTILFLWKSSHERSAGNWQCSENGSDCSKRFHRAEGCPNGWSMKGSDSIPGFTPDLLHDILRHLASLELSSLSVKNPVLPPGCAMMINPLKNPLGKCFGNMGHKKYRSRKEGMFMNQCQGFRGNKSNKLFLAGKGGVSTRWNFPLRNINF